MTKTEGLRVALISEGPSAVDTYPGPEGYDEVIGVNRVPRVWPCSWWVFLDPEFYLEWALVLGRPRIFTTGALEAKLNKGQLRARGIEARFREDRPRITWELQVPVLPPMSSREVHITPGGPRAGQARFTQHAGLAALVCAWYVGGCGQAGTTRVDVYGADMGGIGDCHGVDAPCRTEDRWKEERRTWDGLVRGFEAAGDLAVNRILPVGAEAG